MPETKSSNGGLWFDSITWARMRFAFYRPNNNTQHGPQTTNSQCPSPDLPLPRPQCQQCRGGGRQAELPSTLRADYSYSYVCESTGVFLTKEKSQSIIHHSSFTDVPRRSSSVYNVPVLYWFSSPAKDDSQTIVMGHGSFASTSRVLLLQESEEKTRRTKTLLTSFTLFCWRNCIRVSIH